MIALLIAVQLLSCMQLCATDSPLGSSQKSSTPRAAPYVGLIYPKHKTLEIYCLNSKTRKQLSAKRIGGKTEKVHTIVHVIKTKQ